MSTELVAAFTTGFTSVATDVTTLIGAMVPIAIGIFGTVWVVKKARKWFGSLAG
jgi:hypothetical protein